MANDKEPSFKERIAQMHDVAEQLKSAAEFVAAEATRMAAAEKRFAERRSSKHKAGK
jgi:hypothetical protein